MTWYQDSSKRLATKLPKMTVITYTWIDVTLCDELLKLGQAYDKLGQAYDTWSPY